ncbi:hypothetical protein G6L37_02910 [Agrobacterium rubi]|nr:hypothetical protein [Agrobacterium rubi]NTF24328.1 hypothetical protein [Agrobacterium rubi]
MLSVIVVPTGEEQAKIQRGFDPDVSNIFSRDFSSSSELESYIDGLESLGDLVEWEIVSETPKSVTVEIDGDEVQSTFENEIDKKAYLSGLEDGDGWMSPLVVREDEDPDLFQRLSGLINAYLAKP